MLVSLEDEESARTLDVLDVDGCNRMNVLTTLGLDYTLTKVDVS